MPRPRTLSLVLFTLATTAHPAVAQRAASSRLDWTRGAVCYEVFVRSFYDSDGDGIGDLNGLTGKLDYINDGRAATGTDLGARCIWLMPVAESPSYHGYDVSNYYKVEHDYGTNADFRRFVREAHRRGIRVLVDMVLNHASSEHPAFQAALRDTASPYRAWFRWSRTKPDEKGPWGQEVWHKSPVRDEYYYGVFWSGMPDLNYETPAVRAEAKRVARFWLREMGVDGFRLDAVPYLVEEGKQVAGTPGTHAFLREYGAYVRRAQPASFTVGEVWDSVGAMLPYYPDQLDDYFAFAASDAMIEAVRTGTAAKLLEPFLRLQEAEPPARWSPFLRNHDQTRTMTALGGDVRNARLAATLLLTLPGFPFIYYGEEIGMTGDKPDERLRTPMQWTAGSAGFSRARPWETAQPDTLTTNVAAQTGDAASLLSLYRRLIRLRGTDRALAGGRLVPIETSDPAVAAYLRQSGGRTVLVIANLAGDERSGVTLSSRERVLGPGRYAGATVLGDASVATVQVGADGRIIGWAAVPRLAAKTAYIVALSLTSRGKGR